MKLRCPVCRAVCDISAWQNDEKVWACLKAACELPKNAGAVSLRYIGLFRKPGSDRGMSWERASKLLTELAALINAGWVQWDRGVSRPITPSVWADAMETVIDQLKEPPLKNHNYLRSIAYKRANRQDAHTEYRRNRQERTGQVPITRPEASPERLEPFAGLTKEQMKEMREKNMAKARQKKGTS